MRTTSDVMVSRELKGRVTLIGDRANAHAVDRYIELSYVAVDFLFQMFFDVFQAVGHFLQVVDTTFANEL